MWSREKREKSWHKEQESPRTRSPLSYIRFLTLAPLSHTYLRTSKALLQARYSHSICHVPVQSQILRLDKFTAPDTGRCRLADMSLPEAGKGWIQPGSQFWMTQSKPPTSSYCWLDVYAAADTIGKEGLCWVTASTKPVILQMVQPWQLQEWELHLVLLLLCKLRPQSIHPSLSTKSSAVAWCNLSVSYIHTSVSWSWKTPFKNYQCPCITKQRLSNSSSSFQ